MTHLIFVLQTGIQNILKMFAFYPFSNLLLNSFTTLVQNAIIDFVFASMLPIVFRQTKLHKVYKFLVLISKKN